MKNYLITDKLFPFDADGGTAFTAYEWATELDDRFGGCTVLYHGKKPIEPSLVSFDVIEVNKLIAVFRAFSKMRTGKKVFLNSAFKLFEVMYFAIAIVSKPNFYWLCHGSLDYTLCQGVKKKLYVNLWARLLSKIIKAYISNSFGEHERLPSFITGKSIVIENLFPINTLAFEEVDNKFIGFEKNDNSDEKYDLIFGRIDIKKKIIQTIERLYEINYFTNHKLKIVGVETSPAYIADIENLIEKLNIKKSCELSVSLTRGKDKVLLLKRASNLLLFSDSEGLPVVILEAITLGTRVVCSPGCNVNHLAPYVRVVELSSLSLTDLQDDQFLFKETAIRSLDSGRRKLASFFNDYTA